MKHPLSAAILAVLTALPTGAFALTIQAAPVTSSAPARAPSTVAPSSTAPQEASTDYLLKLEGVNGESTEGATPGVEPDEIDVMVNESSSAPARKGNVEVNWKVEEGESAPGVEPDEIGVMEDPEEASTDYLLKLGGVDGESTKNTVPGVEPEEIDVAVNPQPLTPDFSILLGGGSDSGESEALTEAQQSAVAEILLQGMQEQGAPAETMSLNFEKIKTTSKQQVKLLGFIPVNVDVTVEVDAEGEAVVSYPWWGFLAAGKDDSIGETILTALSTVLTTKHDTIKNAIGNIR